MISKRRSIKTMLSLIMAIALCLSLAIPAFAATEVIASSNTGDSEVINSSDIGGGIGQSFTAEKSGTITSVSADLGHPNGFTDTMDVVCTIYKGIPTDAKSNTPLASATIQITDANHPHASERTFDFSGVPVPVTVQAGSVYTVVFTNNSADDSEWLKSPPTYKCSQSNPYLGGTMIKVAAEGVSPHFYASYSETTGDLNFSINADVKIPISTYSIDPIPVQLWTGSPVTPIVTVQGLTENTDFTVAYSNNTDPGTATVTVTGMGEYAGTLTAEFLIAVPFTPPPATVTASETEEPSDDSIAYLVDLGVIDLESFDPDAVVTRADFVVMLAKAAGADTSTFTTAYFTDVTTDDAFFSAVNWASANGIILGDGAGMFSPNDPITRQDIATILLRYAGYMSFTMPQTIAPVTYDDNGSVISYAQAGVAAMQMAGVMSAYENNDFGPMMNVTGASIADILAVFLQLM